MRVSETLTRLALRSLVATVSLATLGAPLACGHPGRLEYPAPTVQLTSAQAADSWSSVERIFAARCVVCHGCYDAPCQLKLGTFEGIARGASPVQVYDGARLLASSPTRLEVDAHEPRAWRGKGFHPVLPEGKDATPGESLLLQMLELKRSNPQPDASDIAEVFTLDLDRQQVCTKAERFGEYASDHPRWGMPYALPGLDPTDDAAITEWVSAGAPHTDPEPLAPMILAAIDSWESFLNGPSLKTQLMGRYIYEHLFLASLYFDGIDGETFFRLVRSRAPSGAAIDEIPTRRPFDDPNLEGESRVHYRFAQRLERPLEKTHMPYPLSAGRLKRFRELFLEPKYVVTALPTYDPEVGANPFRAFRAIPAESRYRFMLEEAEFTMMGFIKGPVCRGQVALNVIDDRFWIAFLSPDVPWMGEETAFLAEVRQDLDMPAEGGSTALPTHWLKYGRAHARYVKKRAEFLAEVTKRGEGVTLGLVWDGDGSNANAALTVYRHFDSATVVKGFVGGSPKTAWIVGYPLLERIHYLLVAGFDVFGNVGHQGTTRLYMDFLRMEGEANFLMFLPKPARTELADAWYRGVSGAAMARIRSDLTEGATPNVRYAPVDAKEQLLTMLEARLAPVLGRGFDRPILGDPSLQAAVERLEQVRGRAASWMPETSFLSIRAGDGPGANVTILRDSAHTNVLHLFNEQNRRVETEDSLAVVRGFLGAYPNALFEVQRKDLAAFVEAVSTLDGLAAYRTLRRRFGVLRVGDEFWSHADRIHAEHRREEPTASGWFDFNRLEPY